MSGGVELSRQQSAHGKQIKPGWRLNSHGAHRDYQMHRDHLALVKTYAWTCSTNAYMKKRK